MALYLGNQKVTPSITNTITRTITQNQSGAVISDTTSQPYTTYEDPDNKISDLPVVTEWQRPNGWPNLDALPELTEGIYLTYDNTNNAGHKWASFYCVTNTGSVRIAQGHVNGNSWVQDSYVDVASKAYKEIDYSSASSDYVVFKITPASTNHIQQFYFARIAAATAGTLALIQQYDQYCLERVGKLPYLTTTIGDGNNYRYSAQYIERDNVEFGNVLTSLQAAWYRARSLQKIEWGDWTGEGCNITNLTSTFQECHAIEKINLSQWNTSNWHVISITALFLNCYNMKICIVPFNTTNWGNGASRTFTMDRAWSTCMSLEHLDLNSWDMSNLNVTTIYDCWVSCYHLKSLNIKNWKTSNWTVNGTNGLYRVWAHCRLLVDIDLSGWDTSNWTPVRADSMFENNHKRRNFDDIKYWNTSNWAIAQFNNTFNGCYKVQELDLHNWNTSNWRVTTLTYAFSNMHSVRTINLTGWNTAGNINHPWAVTNINYIFLNDYNLEEIKGFWNWDVSKWPVTNFGYQMFYCCFRLKEINFHNWVTTNWVYDSAGKTDIRYLASNCYLVKKIDLSPFDLDMITSLTYYSYNAAGSRSYSPFYLCYNLQELTLPSNYKGHIDLSDAYKMPRSEFIKIFNALSSSPIGTTAKVWVITTKMKLTTEDIAIATNKGYTVVQS